MLARALQRQHSSEPLPNEGFHYCKAFQGLYSHTLQRELRAFDEQWLCVSVLPDGHSSSA